MTNRIDVMDHAQYETLQADCYRAWSSWSSYAADNGLDALDLEAMGLYLDGFNAGRESAEAPCTTA